MNRRLIVLLATIALLSAACSGAKSTEDAAKVDAGPTTTASGSGPDGGATDSTAVAGPGEGTGVTAAGGGTPKSGTAKAGGSTGSTVASGGSAPRSTLFTAKEDTVGITKAQLTMCGHAALTYAPAFNTEVDDLNVYWTAINDEKGGIYGRKVVMTYENDNYDPQTAVTAATACKGKNPFLLLGGIGFDQIPAVRNWAEQNRVPYMHHIATVKGSAGKRFSYGPLPTVEKMGEMFAEVMIARYKGKKLGIIKRNSPNWEPGVEGFKVLAKKYNINVVAERAVTANQGNYTQEILDMKGAGAEIVWLWENALISTEIVKQAKAQQYSPTYLAFPFNLTSQTLENDAMTPKMIGVAAWAAYSKGETTGSFASYADDIKEFERQYAKYDPGADLNGVAGDLLFLNWQAQRALHALFLDCGKDCTRNRFIDVLTGYKKVPTSSACTMDFTRADTHVGGYSVNLMETYRAPGGKVNWRNTDTCVEHLVK